MLHVRYTARAGMPHSKRRSSRLSRPPERPRTRSLREPSERRGWRMLHVHYTARAGMPHSKRRSSRLSRPPEHPVCPESHPEHRGEPAQSLAACSTCITPHSRACCHLKRRRSQLPRPPEDPENPIPPGAPERRDERMLHVHHTALASTSSLEKAEISTVGRIRLKPIWH
jgi:hypothetical protein